MKVTATIQRSDIHHALGDCPLIHVSIGAHATIESCKVHDTVPSGICVKEGGSVDGSTHRIPGVPK